MMTTQAEEDLLKLINNPKWGTAIGQTLAEIAVELLDAKAEAAHWKKSFETVRDEIKVLAAVAIRQNGLGRLVVTRKELLSVPENTQLYVGTPEPGVRIYELRRKSETVSEAIESIIRMN
jgi:hypothetical protein